MHDEEEKTEDLFIEATDGREVRLALTADCCSESYFERMSVKEALSLYDQELQSIRQVSSKISDFEDSENFKAIKYHAIELVTDVGVTTIDWRNDSNGYYDGTCAVLGWDGETK